MEKKKSKFFDFSVGLSDIRLLLLATIFMMAVMIYNFNVNPNNQLTEVLALSAPETTDTIVNIPTSEEKSESAQPTKTDQEADAPIKNIEIEILKLGGGKQALRGKEISFHYRSELLDGKVLDNAYYRRPIQIKLGDNAIIPGLDIGIEGMRVGGKRHITIPPKYAWGESDFGAVPPNATVVFEVELMSVFE